jgi:N-acylglucosamine 2-epimerase
MYFEMTADGKPIRKRRYLFSECFACIAMSEYAQASGDLTYADKALELFKQILYFKNTEDLLPSKYESDFRIKGLSLPMILLNTAMRIREVIADDVLDKEIENSISLIKNDFLHPEFKALLEVTTDTGKFIDSNLGRTVNPGHSIEAAWFIFEEAKYRKWDPELVKLATTILDWSWEIGWDKQYGGILNFVDCKGLPHQDYSQDMKFWWPHTEGIIAALYAYQATGDAKYLAMHQQIHDYTYRVFPDSEFGEWYGYLHRDGKVAQPAKGNLFKGPFHIPRMMIIASELCKQIYSSHNQLLLEMSIEI